MGLRKKTKKLLHKHGWLKDEELDRKIAAEKARQATVSDGLTSDILFQGEDLLFKDAIENCTVYGEYGCGQSSVWVANNTDCQLISVDTSAEWIENVQQLVGKRDRFSIFHIDLGPLASWGRPTSYVKMDFFDEYTDRIWQQKTKPDLVLIDGRFRVCCFLTCLKLADEGTVLIFDDYIPRAKYKIVEDFLKPIKTNSRQAKFIVPPKHELDLEKLDRMIDRFRCVFD